MVVFFGENLGVLHHSPELESPKILNVFMVFNSVPNICTAIKGHRDIFMGYHFDIIKITLNIKDYFVDETL